MSQTRPVGLNSRRNDIQSVLTGPNQSFVRCRQNGRDRCRCDRRPTRQSICAFGRRTRPTQSRVFAPKPLLDRPQRRNCIEGLFLSSGIARNEDDTMADLVRVAKALRTLLKVVSTREGVPISLEIV